MSARGVRDRIREGLERPLTRRVLALALVIAAVVCAAQVHRRASRPIGNDLTSYLLSASALWAGEDPYATRTVFPYIYPLFLAFTLGPLTLLPAMLAQALWLAAGMAALWLACRLFLDVAAAPTSVGDPRRAAGACALLALFLLDPIQINLVNGQVNFVVLALLALFLRAHLRGRWAAAGMLLGAAVAIKLVPAALLAFLAARRALRTLIVAVVSAVGFCLLPYLCAGPRLWSYYERYFQSFILARAQGSAAASSEIVFSLPATASALLPGAPWWMTAVLSAIAVFGPAFWLAYRRPGPGTAVWAFALFLLAMPLLTPMSEVHHLALLFPAAAATTLALLYRPGPVDLVTAGLTSAAWIAFWVGRLDRLGPYYLIALVLFYLATLRAESR